MAQNVQEGEGYRRFGSGLITQTQKLKKRLFSRRRHEGDRTVYIDNQILPGESVEKLPVYPDNTVVSSKYTIITFLPKNLFEQLRRVANFYFLCVALIQFVIDTPVTPLTSILPLGFVIAVTAIKQGYEDWLRHRADNEVNNRPAYIIRNGQHHDVSAKDIKVGDLVKVLVNEEFPCDLVLLSSEDPQGQCFVTTANLDGETNLKTHYCLQETRGLSTPAQLGSLRAKIKCKAPIPDLYTFEGVMEFGPEIEAKPLSLENLLLRGARLKNTAYIYGCAVYTGIDTKMALNSKAKKQKFSRVEKKMNAFLIVFLIILLGESVLSTGLKYWFEDTYGVFPFVTKESFSNEALKAIETALAFMVIYNYIIPISLYVTVELQKFLGSIFFGWDVEMYDPSVDERAKANTSDLNEELGQVEYLFTDKTGTLTENTMAFRRCCIGKRQFEMIDGHLCERTPEQIDLNHAVTFTDEINEFIRVLSLCHTVRVDRHNLESKTQNGASSQYSPTGEDYEYQASSPDEKALVEACCRFGVVYHGTNDDIMEVSFQQKMKKFKLLHTLPFDPTRKRMSVIIQDLDDLEDTKYLLCKGADMAVIDKSVTGEKVEIQNMIDEYAEFGLRTLSIAQRKLEEKEYEDLDRRLMEARRSLVQRNEKLSDMYREFETKLHLLGATAVEDKLQHEVPQTIEALRMAGIKVWVLTGDKEETAVNISHAAGHFNSDMEELRLTQVRSQEQSDEQLKTLLQSVTLSDQDTEYALIIDGQSLAYALKDHSDWLCQLCSKCVAVLCCRMSPLQKAQIVAMIKNSKSKPVTAAIGDGANDVSMIQEADVGFGIMGKEGRQAVRNSDFAFGKFRFLRRALLLHGHLYYTRIAVLVQYFFYKNVAWITGQLLYAIFSSWSEQSLFDAFYLLCYNLCFTSLPILIYGIFEQHKTKDALLNNPSLYKSIARNATLNWIEFFKWNFLGLWHCCVFFFGTYLLQQNGVSLYSTGETLGNFDFGSLIYFTCLGTVNIKLMLVTYYWCLPTFLSYIITFIGIILLTAVYTNLFWPAAVASSNSLYKSIAQLYSGAATWLAMILMVVLALLPDILIRAVKDIRWSQQEMKWHREGKMNRANGQAPIDLVSHNKRQVGKNAALSTISEDIELQNKNKSSPSGLRGYVNPVLSLSSENIVSSARSSPMSEKHAYTNKAFTLIEEVSPTSHDSKQPSTSSPETEAEHKSSPAMFSNKLVVGRKLSSESIDTSVITTSFSSLNHSPPPPQHLTNVWAKDSSHGTPLASKDTVIKSDSIVIETVSSSVYVEDLESTIPPSVDLSLANNTEIAAMPGNSLGSSNEIGVGKQPTMVVNAVEASHKQNINVSPSHVEITTHGHKAANSHMPEVNGEKEIML
ncbi:phospholipid-transporting ATPase IF-like isoform X2 [Biomphalaria glabrata]|uniref:Phospholipid-transporting ATPase n=1 Tax=Biomphalaria glabrata TaxID=6526 RepID=A0A9W2Z261_BIOGL|nr:phospholipid-transporting ATPase IF-like isoform X2 [Biomphalaria glabrata]